MEAPAWAEVPAWVQVPAWVEELAEAAASEDSQDQRRLLPGLG